MQLRAIQLGRTRSKYNIAKARAKARETKQRKNVRPDSPPPADLSELMVPDKQVRCDETARHVTAEDLTNSAINFWEQLHEDHQNETHKKWQQDQQEPKHRYKSFADALLGNQIQTATTGAVLFAKKRKLQRLTVPKIMLATIDLNSPKRCLSSDSIDEIISQQSSSLQPECAGEVEKVEQDEEDYDYVFVNDEEEYDFVDGVLY